MNNFKISLTQKKIKQFQNLQSVPPMSRYGICGHALILSPTKVVRLLLPSTPMDKVVICLETKEGPPCCLGLVSLKNFVAIIAVKLDHCCPFILFFFHNVLLS